MVIPEQPAARRSDGEQKSVLSTIALPKGGGAIRGIGEKFAANPVTGTGSVSIPIAASPGRAGFGPELSLSYDSGSGNGPFGFGWTLSLPSVSRKTEKGLPRYHDFEESAVFLLTGTEDLVPRFKPDPAVYRIAEESFGVTRTLIGFVSSNGWDAAGAKSFGFRVFWVNRAGQPVERLGVRPDATVRDLSELAAQIAPVSERLGSF